MYRYILVLLTVITQFLYAQDKSWSLINTGNSSLPNETVKCIVFDSEGSMWVGTYMGGLAVLKNNVWTVYNTSNSELPHNYINSIAIDKNNVKWIGTDGGGLAKFDGTSWQVFKTSTSGLPSNVVMSVYCDSNGVLWVGTYFGGLARFDGQNWTVYNDENSPLVSNKIVAIEKDNNDRLWVGTQGGGLGSFDGNVWTIYSEKNSKLTSDYIYSIAIDKENNKWVGTGGGGVAVFNDVFWISYNSKNSKIADDNIRPIMVDENNNKWIGTYIGGVNLFNSEEWKVFDYQNSSMPDDEITCLAYKYPNLFIGTERFGIVVFQDNSRPQPSKIEEEIATIVTPPIIIEDKTDEVEPKQKEITQEPILVVESKAISAEDTGAEIEAEQKEIPQEPILVVESNTINIEDTATEVEPEQKEIPQEPILIVESKAINEEDTGAEIEAEQKEIPQEPILVVESNTINIEDTATEVEPEQKEIPQEPILIVESKTINLADTTTEIEPQQKAIPEEPILVVESNMINIADTTAEIEPAQKEIQQELIQISDVKTRNKIVLLFDAADVFFDKSRLNMYRRSFKLLLRNRDRINDTYDVTLMIYSSNYDLSPKKIQFTEKDMKVLRIKNIIYLEGETQFTEAVKKAFINIEDEYNSYGSNQVIAATYKFINDDETAKVVVKEYTDKYNIVFSLLAYETSTWEMEYKMQDIVPKGSNRYYSINRSSIKDNWSVTGQIGLSMFRGDLDVNSVITFPGEFGFAVNKQVLSTGILNGGIKGQFNFGHLQGSKNDYSFENKYKEGSLNFQVILNTWVNRNFRFEKVRPYAFTGIGFINYRVLLRDPNGYVVNGYGYEVVEGDLEGNGKNPEKDKAITDLVIPVGAGLNYKLNNKINIELEASSRFINSDRLDGKVNGKNDKYWFVSVGVTYMFSNKEFIADILNR
jgi:hypothetical protein